MNNDIFVNNEMYIISAMLAGYQVTYFHFSVFTLEFLYFWLISMFCNPVDKTHVNKYYLCDGLETWFLVMKSCYWKFGKGVLFDYL